MRLPLFLLTFALAIPLVAAEPPENANNRKTVTVMTRNLYVGADLLPAVLAIASGDPVAIVTAVSETFGKVQFTDFNARAEGIAHEIDAAQPDLVGLQEVTTWRSQTPADFIAAHRYPPSSFYHLLSGRRTPSFERLRQLAKELGVTLCWLLLGEDGEREVLAHRRQPR
jgi:hypothetical protein